MFICGLRAIYSVWRNQLVSFRGYLSEWGAVSVGCSRAPLLFSIYVDDLRTVVKHSQMNMYADDTKLHLNGHDLLSVQHGFQCNLDAIQAWLCVNRLQLDASKLVVMLIDTRKKISHGNVTVHISGQAIT